MTRIVDRKATGERIRKLREERGISVRELQRHPDLNLASHQAIYKWEIGQNVPCIDHLLILCEIFDVEITDIIVTKDSIDK